MKFIFTFSMVFFLCISWGRCDFNPSYDPEDWPEYVIKFKEDGTLGDLFNSGIRPFRFPGLEKSCLDFKHARIVIESKSGELFPRIDVEYGEIYPLQGGLLSNMEINSPKLPIGKAEILMQAFLAKGTRTQEQLRRFLTLASSDPSDYDDPSRGAADRFTIAWSDAGGLDYYVGFKKTFDPSAPVRFVMGLSWGPPSRTPLQQRSFYKIPIPPPPGYESVSMDAPKNFGPDSAVEIARSKGLPITGDRTAEEYEKQWRLSQQKNRSSNLENQRVAAERKGGPARAVWIALIALGGTLVMIILLRWWNRARRGTGSSHV